jgi:hypothetical protein
LLAVTWAMIGLVLILGFACWRMSTYTLESFSMPLYATHWAVFIGFTIFMLYSEGYKGFQKKFSPRFAARCKYLLHHASRTQLIFAPFFCMAYFHAPKKRIIARLILTCMIITFIISFRFIPQPWRGLLDAGVMLGLIWGVIATLIYCFKAFTDENFIWDDEVLVPS